MLVHILELTVIKLATVDHWTQNWLKCCYFNSLMWTLYLTNPQRRPLLAILHLIKSFSQVSFDLNTFQYSINIHFFVESRQEVPG